MEEIKSTGNVKITGSLNPRTGEYWFEVASENGVKSTKNKCLFDALSDFGIHYDLAKDILSKYAASYGKTVTFETFSDDYYKHIPHTKRAERINSKR